MIRKIIRYTIGVAFLGLMVYTFYFLYEKNREPDKVYETTTAEYRDIVRQTVATGSVVPRQEILIKPQVSGIVDKLFVEEGHHVKVGDLIARVKVIPDMLNLQNAENRLGRAEIGYDNAQIDLDRGKKLYKGEVISDAEFQQIGLAYKNALQELEAAKESLEIIKEGVSSKKGDESNTLIRATKAGTILDVPVEEGNSVIETNNFNEGTTIAIVADLSDMIFEGKVDESEVGKIKTGMDITLTIGAIQDEEYNAKLEFISPKGVEESGAIQFGIKAALKLREGSFVRAGYSANAEIVLEKKENVLTVKESLVTYSGDSVYIEVEKGKQRFERKLVELGLSDGIYAEVLSDLDTTARIKVPAAEVEAK